MEYVVYIVLKSIVNYLVLLYVGFVVEGFCDDFGGKMIVIVGEVVNFYFCVWNVCFD